MKKIHYFYLVVLMLSYSQFILANEAISWKLGSDNSLIDKVKSMNFRADDKAVGIHYLISHSVIDIHPKRVKKHVRQAMYYNDTVSLQNYGTNTITFNKRSETVVIYQAGIIRKNGEYIPFNPVNAQVLDTDTYNVFSNTMEIVIPFSAVEIGAIAVLDYEIRTNKQLEEADWSQVFYPQTSNPLKSFDLIVNWHDGIKQQWHSASQFVDCQNQSSTLTCQGIDIPGATSDHVVQWYDELGQISIGETDSWNDVISNSTQKFNLALKSTTGIKDIIESIIQVDDSLEQKISGIHNFVAREIRYTSFSGQGHSITPHAVAETISNRYGDCKDKSALLLELLKQVSIKPYPVLIATNRRSAEALKIPAMNYFDHMVVCFTYLGKEICLDATDTQTDWQTTSNWIQGKVALRLIKNETPSIIRKEKYRWNLSVNTKVKFTDEGGLEEEQSRTYKSNYASWYRQNLASKNTQERIQWIVNQYKKQISSTAEPEIKISGIEQIKPEVLVTTFTRFPTFLDISKDLFYIDYEAWVSYEIDSLFLKNKVYNSFSPGLKMVSKYQFDTQVHWKISHTSPELKLKHKYGSIHRTVMENDNKTTIVTKIEVPSRNVPASDVAMFNKFLKLIKRESTINIHGVKLQ